MLDLNKIGSGDFSEIESGSSADQGSAAQPDHLAAITHALIGTEGSAHDAVSPKGARGTMQIMPGTFRQYAKDGESFDNEADRMAAASRKIADDYSWASSRSNDPKKVEGLVAAAYQGGRGGAIEWENGNGSSRNDGGNGYKGLNIDEYVNRYFEKRLGKMNAQPAEKPAPYYDPTAGDAEKAQKKSDEAPISTSLKRGWNQMTDAVANAYDVSQGNDEAVVTRMKKADEFDQKNPSPTANKQWMEDWKDSNTSGWLGNLAGFVGNSTEQLANSIPSMVGSVPGMMVGGSVGTTFGPVGVLVGGVVGGFVGSAPGSIATETGSRLTEMMQRDNVNMNDSGAMRDWLRANHDKIIEEGTVKGLTTAMWDGIAGGAAQRIIAGPMLKFAQKDVATLSGMGINTSDQVALAAARNSVGYKTLMAAPAAELKAATTMGQNAMRGVAGFAGEMLGEGGGEYYGEKWATGEGHLDEALLEALFAGGNATVTTAAGFAYRRTLGEKAGKSALDALAEFVPPTPNSPLSNAVAAGAPLSTPLSDAGAQAGNGQPDAFAQRMSAVQARLEDPTLLRTIRSTEGLGPESVTELLNAWGIARNPTIDPAMREKAMQGIEGAFHTFDNRPDFTLSKEKPQPVSGLLGHEPGTDVGPTDGGGGSAQGPSKGGPVDFPGNVYEGESSRVTDTADLPHHDIGAGDIATTPAASNSGIAQRHAAIRHMVGQGFNGIEKEGNAYTLTHPKTGQTYPLLSPADTLIARAAIRKQMDDAAHGAASSPNNDLALPTQAQIGAENYKKGHINLHGLDIAVENPQGSTRSGVSPEGKAWESKLNHHYGYIKRTEGADGDPVDVFLGNRPDLNWVFMVDQIDPATGEFDEHKVMLGFDDEDSARKGYLANYEKGWKGLGAITPMSMFDFKTWLKEGDTTKPVGKPDRRHDAETRKLVKEMTLEEARTALMTDHLTGIKNRRAYDESEKLPIQVSIDADSLKWVNDNMGHQEGGDAMLKIIADALDFETGDAYHISGDEFVVQAYTEDEANEIMAAVQKSLDQSTIKVTKEDGETITLKGIGASYGTGKDINTAELGLASDKQRRESEGLRAARGEQPPGATRKGGSQRSEPDSQLGSVGATETGNQSEPASQVTQDTSSAPVSGNQPDSTVISRDWIKPEIEALIRQKANAGQTGKSHSIDKLIALTKRLLAGEDIKPGKFKSFVADFKNLSAVAEVAQRIHDHIKEDEKQSKAAEKLKALGDETANDKQDQSADLNPQTDLESKQEAGNKGFVKLGDNPDGSEIWGDAAGTRQRRNGGVVTGEMMRAGGEDQAPSDGRYQTKAEIESSRLKAAEDLTSEAHNADESRRKIEKESFAAMLEDPEIIGAAGSTDVEAQVTRWLGDEISKAATDGDAERVQALSALLKDGKPVLPVEFFDSLVSEANKRAKQVKQDTINAASREFAAMAMAEQNILGDTGKAMFLEGWYHALEGNTKSTMPSDALRAKGYEAAQQWLSTPEGRAAFTGKRSKKLENTGADLRRWYEQQRGKIKDATDTDAVIAALELATNRAELMRTVLTEKATPGAQRWLEQLRNGIMPFKRWLDERGPLRRSGGQYVRGRNNYTERLRLYLEGQRYVSDHRDETRDQRIERLQQAADEYTTILQHLTDALEGSDSITEASKAFSGMMFTNVALADQAMNAYREDLYSVAGKQVAGLMIYAAKSLNRLAWLGATEKDQTYNLRGLLDTESSTFESQRKASLVPPRMDSIEREGDDYREGANVTPQHFKQKFDFADVGFGKWVGAKQDQDHLNYSYDAFLDLAKLLNLPTEAISLGGRLHFTIGALGRGKFAAHYAKENPHPDGGTVPVINVTNTRGDGTVAHEWGHALDLTPQSIEDDAGFSKTGGDYSYLSRAIAEIKRDLSYAYNFDAVRNGVMRMIKGESWWKGDKRTAATDGGRMDNAQRAIDYYAGAGNQRSDYYKEAFKLDGTTVKDPYWSNDKELFARAFEAWVGDTLPGPSTYLVNTDWTGEGNVTSKTHRGTPYPAGEERERFNAWFDTLAKSLIYDADLKVVRLDTEKWNASKPQHADEWKQALQDLKDSLPAMIEQVKAEQVLRDAEQRNAVEHGKTIKVGDIVKARNIGGFISRFAGLYAVTDTEKSGKDTTGITFSDENGTPHRYDPQYFEVVERKLDADLKAQADAKEEAEKPQPAVEPTSELSTDDLERLFDEAASEITESTAEQPAAPEPGQPIGTLASGWTKEDIDFLRKEVEAGKIILVGDKNLGIPTIHDMKDSRHLGGGMFLTSNQTFEATWDGGGAMQHTPSGHGYTEVHVNRGESPFNREAVLRALDGMLRTPDIELSGEDAHDYNRWLSDQRGAGRNPTDKEKQDYKRSLINTENADVLSVKWDAMGYGARQDIAEASDIAGMRKVVHRISGSKWAELGTSEQESMRKAASTGRDGKLPTIDQQAEKTAGMLAAEAAKLGVTGISEALKGLTKLFGGGPGKLQSFPSGLDKETYKQAKPHFEAALKAFQDAGKTVKDLFKFLIEQFGMGVKPYAIQFAKENGLSASLGKQPSAVLKVAQFVSEKIGNGKTFTARDLFAESDIAYGGTQSEGKYSPKDAYDAMEMGVNLAIRDYDVFIDVNAEDAASSARGLKRLIENLPTQTRRDAEMDEFQQFSTPPALAYVSNWVANIHPLDVMMEPSAGTGDLAIWAEKAGASLILNELSSRRASVLKELFPAARIFTENAEQLNNVLPKAAVPTVVVMNPPFSSTAGRVHGSRDTMNGARHIEQALKRLAPGGRLVAIVGNGMAADRPAFKKWWKELSTVYNVKANIGIDGKEYAKYGTTFDNQILVIDKDGPTQGTVLTGKVDAVSDLPQLLEGIRNDRPEATLGNHGSEQAADQSGGSNLSAPNGLAGKSDPSSLPGADDVGAGKRGGSQGNGRAGASAGQPGKSAGTGRAEQTGRGEPGRGNAPGSGESTSGSAAGEPGSADWNLDATGAERSGLTVEQAESKNPSGTLTDAVFESYYPQRLTIPGAKEHPGKLVQSSAMASVEPPATRYTPNLSKEVISKGLLSLAQIESVVYAGQAHSEFLPSGERRGFFIGDGTGVGKGREISGIILDNLRQGRDKAVWVSYNEGLLIDAKRDFSGVGGDKDLLFWQGKTKPANPLAAKNGILFTTYSTLRGGEKKQANTAGQKQGKSRADQIVEWLGEDFDGVIVFDEAHSMGNAISMKGKRGTKKASQQALAGINLQKRIPQARLVYVSATGATEVSNLAYASRLGLWGEGTPFAAVTDFIGNISNGGVAAMELISRDMKALGMYIARSLSFDGVTYERLDHDLTPLQLDIYNELAKTWQMVLQNVNSALEITKQGKDGKAKSAALSRFWGTHQRFFNQIITSMQTPTVIEDMRRQIDAGNAVVIQLVNTNEAEQERQVAKAQADDVPLEELDFTPRQALMDYVRNAFPVQAYQESTDEEGNKIYNPVLDAEGNPVFDADAVAMRDELLQTLESIRVPENPIDAVINAFGSDKVGEVTGRGRRFVQKRDEDGNLTVAEEKRGNHAARQDAESFQDDKKPILIFSQAGGTGYSFHADKTAKNQRRRIHYILQPGWRADAAVQGFGRTHRTNEASEPHYVLPTTNLKAQKRFVSSIARKLDQLGALTRGERQATSQGLFSASDNLESKYADDALDVFFQDLYAGKTALDFSEVTKAMGMDSLIDKKTGGLNTSNLPEIPRFLNRLLSLQAHEQDAVFDEFAKRLDEVVNYAVQNGTYDNGMQTLKAESVKKVRDEVAHTDERTGAQTRYVELDVTNPVKYLTWQKAKNWTANHGDKFAGWFKDAKGKVFALADLGNRVTADGKVVYRGVKIDIRDGYTHYIDNVQDIQRGHHWVIRNGRSTQETISTALKEDEAKQAWGEQVAAAPTHETHRERMIVGVILPVWDRVEGHPRIVRVQTDDGERMIGRVMKPKDADKTMKNLGVGSTVSKIPHKEVLARVMAGDRAILGNGWEISKSLVSGEPRIEVKTPSGYFSAGDMKILNEQGAFAERIQWKDRVFIPTGAETETVFSRIVSGKQVVELYGKDGKQEDSDTSALRRASHSDNAPVSRVAADALIASVSERFHTPFVTVERFSQLPDQVQRSARAQGGDENNTKGLLHGGQIYVVLNNHHSMADLQETLFHEMVGHHGLRKLLGPDFVQKLNALFSQLGGLAGLTKIADERNFGGVFREYIQGVKDARANDPERYRDEIARQILTEEVFAHIAEKRPDLMDRFMALVGMVRDWLRKTGFAKLAEYGESDILHLLNKARKGLTDPTGPRGGKLPDNNGDTTAVLSKSADGVKFAHEVLAELSDIDEMFRYPISRSMTLDGVMEEVFPEAHYLGEDTREDERNESGADRRFVFRTALGKMFYVYGRGNEVWLDVSRLEAGERGQGIYAAVANYAHNAGKVFIGDPAGLSEDAIIRRTSNMLSSALRFGTTKHLEAAPEQIKGIPEKGIAPLDWHGNDVAKTRALIDTFVSTLENQFPGIKEYHYDFNRRQFADTNGNPVSIGNAIRADRGREGAVVQDGTWETDRAGVSIRPVGRERDGELPGSGVSGIAQSARAREARAGEATLRRAIFLKSLISSESGQRPGILEQVLRRGRSLVSDGGLTAMLRRSADFNTADFREDIRQKLADTFNTKRTFNSWWHKSVGTQYHKAEVDPEHFGKVFNMSQRFIDDLARYANKAADKAPSLLPKLEKLRDTVTGLLHIRQDAKDAKAIAEPIFQGTLNDKIYTDSELETRFGLNAKQVGLYHEFRNAVDQSLDDLAISEMSRLAKMEGLEKAPEGLGLYEATKFYQDQFEGGLERAQEAMADLKERQRSERGLLEQAADDEASSAEQRKRYAELLLGMRDRHSNEMEQAKTLLDNFTQLQQGITEKYQKIEQLKKNGYAPLTRFGDYTVDVFLAGEDGKPIKDASGEEIRHFFGMFESEAEANKVARIMQEEYPEATIKQGVLSQEASQLFKGVTPETVELFAQMAGQEQSDAFQKYLKMAVNNRSAMKRLIKRSGVAGFSEDPTRVLASFLTSNARAAASNDYLGDMLRAAAAIPKEKGDVKDEAVKLMSYIQNPQEEASTLRGLLFISYLGGSVAAMLTNMTQPVLVSFPYLHQFSTNAGSHLAWAMKHSSKKLFGQDVNLDDKGLMAAMKRAEEEGITSPHEIHMLYGESMRTGAFQHTRWFRNITKVWGSFFSLAESFNRHATFMAAYKIAEEKGMAADDAYEFSKKSVYETQFIYSKANRPNWARGAVGATLFTFKQFSISYIEFLKRLPAKERALALGILILAAGMQGMPGADDLDDLIDMLAEQMGFSLNSKQAKRDFVAKLLGKEAAGYVMYGVSHGLPLDVAGRLSVGNLIPGTGIFKKSEQDESRDMKEIAGPVGSFATEILHAAKNGSGFDSVKAALPKAIQDGFKGYDMWMTGAAHDKKGRRIADVTKLDAAIRFIGFNPSVLAEGGRDRSIAFQNSSLLKVMQSEIYEKWAQGIAEGDSGKTAAARQELKNWNLNNPDSQIIPKMSSIQRRVKEIKRSADDRFIRSSPKQMKEQISRLLNAE